jgi:hypothetical protein
MSLSMMILRNATDIVWIIVVPIVDIAGCRNHHEQRHKNGIYRAITIPRRKIVIARWKPFCVVVDDDSRQETTVQIQIKIHHPQNRNGKPTTTISTVSAQRPQNGL